MIKDEQQASIHMHSNAIKATVTKVTDSSVTLDIDGQTLDWPADQLSDIKIKDELSVVVFTKDDIESERNEVAKALLNEVMKGGSHEN